MGGRVVVNPWANMASVSWYVSYRIVSGTLYRDTYRIVAFVVSHTPNTQRTNSSQAQAAYAVVLQ